ncbi:MAG: hypothetical protein IPN10_08615 [Saprospiraceae bacterium]|nr:hypothetical protein [Saprospiraceae bacterium]
MSDAGSFDNCTESAHHRDSSVVTCNDVSPKTVEVRFYDNAGNGIMPRFLVNLRPTHRILFSRYPQCRKILVVLSEGETREMYLLNELLAGGPYKC